MKEDAVASVGLIKTMETNGLRIEGDLTTITNALFRRLAEELIKMDISTGHK